jgi:serine protease Do
MLGALLGALLPAHGPRPGPRAGTPHPPPAAAPAQISRDAQRAYETTRDKLVQIRTLLRNSNTQASVGSGFFVSPTASSSPTSTWPASSRWSPSATAASTCRWTARRRSRAAGLRRAQRPGPAARENPGHGRTPQLAFRGADRPLARGERIYSLGNPLDIGFAVTEGTYNGLVQRSFYPRIFFGGALNPGMSGGPALDDAGQVVGINVSKRLDGDLLSFPDPRRIRPGPAGEIRLGPAHHQARPCRSRAPARRAPGPADAALHRRSP